MKKQYITSTLLALALFTGCGDDEFSAQHNQGKNCLECHSFTGGGTVFKGLHIADYDEKNAAQNHKIRLLLSSGNTITYSKGNGYGNYKYSGDKNAIGNFTAQIIDSNGTVVNKSRPDSHNANRLACNRCHTQDGANGAPGRIVNFDVNQNLATSLQ